MSHLLNSVNSIKVGSNSNVSLTAQSMTQTASSDQLWGIDSNGNSKKINGGTKVGDKAFSMITNSAGWGGSNTFVNGTQLQMRGNSCIIERDNSIVTSLYQVGGALWTRGFTVIPGKYIFIANQAADTSAGGSCDAQFYDATNSTYVGPKIHFETGNFSSTLIYYADVSSNTQFQIRVNNVSGTVTLLNNVSLFSCTFQVFKI